MRLSARRISRTNPIDIGRELRKPVLRPTCERLASYDPRKDVGRLRNSNRRRSINSRLSGLQITWGSVYALFHFRLKESAISSLEIPPLSTDESATSSRNYAGLGIFRAQQILHLNVPDRNSFWKDKITLMNSKKCFLSVVVIKFTSSKFLTKSGL